MNGQMCMTWIPDNLVPFLSVLILDCNCKLSNCSNLHQDCNCKLSNCSNLHKDCNCKLSNCSNLHKDRNCKLSNSSNLHNCSNLHKDCNCKLSNCSNLHQDRNCKLSNCSNLHKDNIPETLVVNDFRLIILDWIFDTSDVIQNGRRLLAVVDAPIAWKLMQFVTKTILVFFLKWGIVSFGNLSWLKY